MLADAGPEIDLLFELVRVRYAARLTEDQLADLREHVGAQVAAARALRAIRLTGADEPGQPFAPFRSDA